MGYNDGDDWSAQLFLLLLPVLGTLLTWEVPSDFLCLLIPILELPPLEPSPGGADLSFAMWLEVDPPDASAAGRG